MTVAAADLRDKARRLVGDLPYYAEHCLRIRPKSGGLVPLVLNRVQLEIHGRLEQQLRDTGRVRSWARLVKGKPNFTRKSQPAPDFTPDERHVIAQAAGTVVDLDEIRPASGLSGAVCATSPSDRPECPQKEDGASARAVTAHTPEAA